MPPKRKPLPGKVVEIEKSLGFKWENGIYRKNSDPCNKPFFAALLDGIESLKRRFIKSKPTELTRNPSFETRCEELFTRWGPQIWPPISSTTDTSSWLVDASQQNWGGLYPRNLSYHIAEERDELRNSFRDLIIAKCARYHTNRKQKEREEQSDKAEGVYNGHGSDEKDGIDEDDDDDETFPHSKLSSHAHGFGPAWQTFQPDVPMRRSTSSSIRLSTAREPEHMSEAAEVSEAETGDGATALQPDLALHYERAKASASFLRVDSSTMRHSDIVPIRKTVDPDNRALIKSDRLRTKRSRAAEPEEEVTSSKKQISSTGAGYRESLLSRIVSLKANPTKLKSILCRPTRRSSPRSRISWTSDNLGRLVDLTGSDWMETDFQAHETSDHTPSLDLSKSVVSTNESPVTDAGRHEHSSFTSSGKLRRSISAHTGILEAQADAWSPEIPIDSTHASMDIKNSRTTVNSVRQESSNGRANDRDLDAQSRYSLEPVQSNTIMPSTSRNRLPATSFSAGRGIPLSPSDPSIMRALDQVSADNNFELSEQATSKELPDFRVQATGQVMTVRDDYPTDLNDQQSIARTQSPTQGTSEVEMVSKTTLENAEITVYWISDDKCPSFISLPDCKTHKEFFSLLRKMQPEEYEGKTIREVKCVFPDLKDRDDARIHGCRLYPDDNGNSYERFEGILAEYPGNIKATLDLTIFYRKDESQSQ